MCICCYYKPASSDDEDSDTVGSSSRTDDALKQSFDVRKLNKLFRWTSDDEQHSNLERVQMIRCASPHGSGVTTELVQPPQYSRNILNSSLGVTAQQSLNTYVEKSKSGNDNILCEATSDKPPATLAPHFASEEGHLISSASTIPQDQPEESSPLGRIQFSLKYSFPEMTLELRIIQATNLPAKDFSGTSDPYAKVIILPGKSHKLVTCTKKRTLNPKWNELFSFEGFPYTKLLSKTLYIQVMDYDRFSRDDPIGELYLPLAAVDLLAGQTFWKTLQPCKGHGGKLGQVLISLSYQATLSKLTVIIIKAKDLRAMDINGYSDPYVKIWMLCEGKRILKKKTLVKQRTLDPVFNESFDFTVSYDKIRSTSLVVSVMDYDHIGRNEIIGSVLLGAKSSPAETAHWNEMLLKPRQQVAQWHLLKDIN